MPVNYRFVFHHIPKAGGSSVVKAFREANIQDCRISFKDKVRSPQEGFNKNTGAQLYSSHYAFWDYEPEAKDIYFTWIRNPVDMFYSGFYFYKQGNKPHPDYQPKESLFFIKNCLRPCKTIEEYVDFVLAEQPDRAFPRYMFDLPWERFHFIGDTNQMQSSLKAFNEKYGLDLPELHKNSTEGKRGYREDEIAEFLSREVELYNNLERF
jgi:hypothetical protein